MRFGAIQDKDIGLVVIAKRGFWDMPSRNSPVTYQWGDELQPLWYEEDISYQSLEYEVDLLFDPRTSTLKNMRQVMDSILFQDKFLLDLEFGDANDPNPYDEFQVRLSEFKGYQKYTDGFEKITMVFKDVAPKFYFDYLLQNPSWLRFTTTETTNQGTSFTNSGFNLKPQKIRGANNMPDLDAIPPDIVAKIDTKYKQASRKMYVDFLIDYTPSNLSLTEISVENAARELLRFKSFLKRPQAKGMVYGGEVYDFYCTEGFKVESMNKGTLLKFTLTMDLI